MALDLRNQRVAETVSVEGIMSTPLFGQKVTPADRMFFTEQLELLLSTGVSLHAALVALSKQTTNSALRSLMEELSQDVMQGRPFSQALAQHPEVFSTTYVTLVGAAENGGFLHDVLRQLLEMEEKREELRSTLVAALSYPVFLAFFSFAVVAFILVFVFPKFGKMFVSIKDELPSTTLALMWASDALRHHWPVVLLGVLATVFLTRNWMLSSHGRRVVDGIKLNTPGLRTIFVPVYLVQMLRTMGLSLNNGVSLVDTLRCCRDIIDNTKVAEFLKDVEIRVQEGVDFSIAFREGVFLPPLVKQMIATGDETGSLGKVMIRVAAYYERELGKRLQKLSKTAEPVMLLVMGAIVGVLVSSLILPIFKLTRAVG